MLLAITAIFFLTWAALDEYNKNQLAQGGAGGDESIGIVNEDSEGHEIYKASSCIQCHATDLSGATAPGLLGVGDKYNQEEIISIINDGIGTMPPQGDTLEEADKETLAAWLASQKAEADEEGEAESEE